MRISDWSSDVCSSDLRRSANSSRNGGRAGLRKRIRAAPSVPPAYWRQLSVLPARLWGNSNRRRHPMGELTDTVKAAGNKAAGAIKEATGRNQRDPDLEIGRASGRERVCLNG